jgi:hypothetical protein
MKTQRHAAILRVVRQRRIESQDELREALADTDEPPCRDVHPRLARAESLIAESPGTENPTTDGELR